MDTFASEFADDHARSMVEEDDPQRVRIIRVPEGEVPSPELIAARIDLGAAEYHEHCCSWLMWSTNESVYVNLDTEPACDCGGPEMARAYANREGAQWASE